MSFEVAVERVKHACEKLVCLYNQAKERHSRKTGGEHVLTSFDYEYPRFDMMRNDSPEYGRLVGKEAEAMQHAALLLNEYANTLQHLTYDQPLPDPPPTLDELLSSQSMLA